MSTMDEFSKHSTYSQPSSSPGLYRNYFTASACDSRDNTPKINGSLSRDGNLAPDNQSQRLRSPIRAAIELNIAILLNRTLTAAHTRNFEAGAQHIKDAFDLADLLPGENDLTYAQCQFWQGTLLLEAGQKKAACISFLGALCLIGWRKFESLRLVAYFRQEWETVSLVIKEESRGHDDIATETEQYLFEFIKRACQDPEGIAGRPSPQIESLVDSFLIKKFSANRQPLSFDKPPTQSAKGKETTGEQSMLHEHHESTTDSWHAHGTKGESVSGSQLKSLEERITLMEERLNKEGLVRNYNTYTGSQKKPKANEEEHDSRANSWLYGILQGQVQKPIEEFEKEVQSPRSSPHIVNEVVAKSSASPDQIDRLMEQLKLGRRAHMMPMPAEAVLADIHSKCASRDETLGKYEQNMDELWTSRDQISSPGEPVTPLDIALSDTLSPRQLDNRVQATIGRRKSEGVVLPSPATQHTWIDSRHGIQNVSQLRRASTTTSPLSPNTSSPLRKVSFPGEDVDFPQGEN